MRHDMICKLKFIFSLRCTRSLAYFVISQTCLVFVNGFIKPLTRTRIICPLLRANKRKLFLKPNSETKGSMISRSSLQRPKSSSSSIMAFSPKLGITQRFIKTECKSRSHFSHSNLKFHYTFIFFLSYF